jgi:MFS family permease
MRQAFDFLRADPRLALYGLFMALGSSFGQTFFISQFGGEIRAEFDLTDGQFGTIYGLGTLLSAAVIVYTGGIIDRVDLRRWTICLLPACALACAAMGSVAGPVSLFLAVFLLRQTGQGLMSHTMGHSLGRYSRVGRGKAIAFGSYGFPLGEAVFPIVSVALLAVIGWREVWFGLAAGYLFLALPVALLLLRGHDVRYARYHADMDAAEDAASAPGRPVPSAPIPDIGPPRAPDRQWRRREVLRDARFYLVLPGLLAPSFIVTGLLLHGVRIAEAKGWSHELWAGSIVAYALGSIPASLIFGAFVDRFGAARGLPLFLPPTLFACLILAWGEGTWTPPAFMALSGMTAGMTSVLLVALWAETYGTKFLGEIKALITALSVFASAAAPPLLGWMLDLDWSVAEISLACAVYATLGCLLSVLGVRRFEAR